MNQKIIVATIAITVVLLVASQIYILSSIRSWGEDVDVYAEEDANDDVSQPSLDAMESVKIEEKIDPDTGSIVTPIQDMSDAQIEEIANIYTNPERIYGTVVSISSKSIIVDAKLVDVEKFRQNPTLRPYPGKVEQLEIVIPDEAFSEYLVALSPGQEDVLFYVGYEGDQITLEGVKVNQPSMPLNFEI